ncbi:MULTISPECIES: hypothetical protein [Providencia]|uniref:hypothetical protein n=1 Tax=Providencia TaxID=586 RepID=UPI001B380C13|nr:MULTISPECIES: hypothetical protein [Providencia]MBQ0531913.1 hypothetical protein [Providencia rettgeri]WOB85465.1 hypothetical protein P3L40_17770 [Providencia sp. PROV040]
MRAILLIIKILIVSFLVLFFIAGLVQTFSSEEINRTVSTVMLLVVVSLIIGLSKWWFIPKKIKKDQGNKQPKRNMEVEQLAAKEFSNRKLTQQSQDIVAEPEIIKKEQVTNNDIEPEVTTYVMKNGQSLIWQGTTKPLSLRLRGEDSKLYGIFTRLYLYENGEFNLELTNIDTGEVSTIEEKEIITAVTIGSSRYDFKELCRKVFKLDLHELFEYAKEIRYAAKEIHVIAEFSPIPTTFTYLSSSGKTKRTVDITQYKKNGYGDEYVAGYCHVRNENRTFAVGKIQTMMASEGHKKYYFHDWLIEVAKYD